MVNSRLNDLRAGESKLNKSNFKKFVNTVPEYQTYLSKSGGDGVVLSDVVANCCFE